MNHFTFQDLVIKASFRYRLISVFVAILCLISFHSKADTPVPTSMVATYDPITHQLHINVSWIWTTVANQKVVTAAVFADLNGDGITPTFSSNPATYNSGGNSFPAGLTASDEFLGQMASSLIEGNASSSLPFSDYTDTGIAFQNGFTANKPRSLFPYGLTSAFPATTGSFTMTFTNVNVQPQSICIILYDVHTKIQNGTKVLTDPSTGNHSPLTAGTGHNTDNSFEEGNASDGTVSCQDLASLECAVDVTLNSCQTQTAVDAAYAAWLQSPVPNGCNVGVLTNNSASLGGAPSSCGGSRTVTFTYTVTCPPRPTVTIECTATFTVASSTAISLTCPINLTIESCLSQQQINDAYNQWLGTATASGGCNGVLTNDGGSIGPDACTGGTKTVTYTYTSSCSPFTTTCQATFTVPPSNSQSPIFTYCPEGAYLGCNPTEIPSPANASATSGCGNATITSALGVVIATGCSRSQTRTYTATDACGNSTTCSQTFTWTADTTAPQFTFCPQGGDLGCNPDGIPSAGNATASDACGTPTITSALGEVIEDGCTRTQTRTYTASDACGNSSNCLQTFTWKSDTTQPVIAHAVADQFIQCNDEIVWDTPTFSDNCDQNLTIVYSSDTTYLSQGMVIHRHFTASDDCGNSSTDDSDIAISLQNHPVLNGLPAANVVIECNETPEAALVFGTDYCGNALQVMFDADTIADGCLQIITNTWTATDLSGNSTTYTQTIHVGDTTPPVIVCPANINVTCSDEVPSADIATINANDNCSDVTITSNDEVTNWVCENRFTIHRTYTATDDCGNSSSCIQQIIVFDNIAPVFTSVPENTASCGDIIEFLAPAAIDNCGGQVDITYSDASSVNGNNNDCGQFTTYSKGGWGSPSNSTPGSYRDAHFDGAFPNGLTIGCATGSYTFTTAQSIEDFIPSGGGASVLPVGNAINPNANNVSNNFADQLIAAMLNVGFDGFDPNFGQSSNYLGDLQFASGTFVGMTATQVIALANNVIGGCSNAYTPNSLLSAMESINLSFHEGTTNSGALICGPNNNNECNYTVTRTWTATDACGNHSSANQTVTISDNEDPAVVFAPENAQVQCSSEIPTDEPIFIDNCDTELTILPASSIVAIEPCGYLIHQSWKATDNCGNETTVSRNITVSDTTEPVLYGIPADVTAECGQLPIAPVVYATDNCDEAIEVIFTQSGVQEGCYSNISRTWTATDACGNSTSATQHILVGDTTDPTIVSSPETEIWVECDQNYPDLNVTFTDNCDTDLTTQEISGIVPAACGFDISRSIIATDDCGNSSSFSQIVHIRDTTAPIIVSSPSDITIDCEGEIPSVIDPVFSDNCDNELTIVPASSIVQLACGYQIHRTWTATDDCGNSITAVHNITVADVVAPTVNPYTYYVHVECNEIENYIGITAQDNCGEIHITYTDILNSGGCLGTLARTYHVSDDCGNTTDVEQFISILDTHGPVILNPADATVECENAPSSIPAIEIYDACGYDVTILSATQEIISLNACSYQIIWHWSAIDYCENISEATTTITVVDTTPPVFENSPESMTYSCEESFEIPASPMVVDNCDEFVDVYSSIDTLQGNCPQSYDIVYTWRAYDNCENESIESVVYHIRDTTAPYFENNQNEFTYECDELIPVVQPLAIDNCGEVTLNHTDSDFWNEGCSSGFTRTWIASDECDNSSIFNQYISVVDTTSPVVTGEFELTIPCDEFSGIYIAATDNCNEVTIDFSDEQVSGSCAGKYIRTYFVSDECGNSTEFMQIINLIDLTDPIIENPAFDLSIECGNPYASYYPVFSDNCDQELTITDSTSITLSENGCTQYIFQSWTATDDCNNSITVDRTITITDTTAPEFNALPLDHNFDCGDVISVDVVTATDLCDQEVTVTHSDVIEVGNCPSNYTIVRTWTAVDNCGNVSTYVQHINVTDTQEPEFTFVPAFAEFNCESDVIYGQAVAEDNCSTVNVTSFDEYDYECANTYTITRTWIATDACGNVAYAYTTYHVFDVTAPTFNQELIDINVECASEIPQPAVVTATDNCGSASVDVNIIEIETDECGNQVLYVQYTAVDDCDNINYTGYYITVNDETDPILFGCPGDLVVDCNDEIPAPASVTATDNCDNDITVVYEQFMFGDLPAEGSISDCNLITPVRPANNPCVYPVDWAMAMFGMPNAHKFYTVQNGNLVQYPNGSAHVTAELHNAQNPANGWNIDIWFNNGMNWSDWSTQGFPTSFKADCGGEAINHVDWTYFILQASEGAEMTGFGGYAGSSLNLIHAPANQYFGFQLGNGANNYNGADNGFGGWFSYNGFFQINNVPYGNNQGNISGAGDLAFELDCCPDYYVVRQWTATDCSGNTTTCTQNVSFGDVTSTPQSPELAGKEITSKPLVVSLAPNPAITNTWFTFVPNQKAQTSLEIFDLSGAKVAEVFVGNVEAGIEYKVDYNVTKMSTGIYMYRLKNGTEVEIGRLVISK